MGYDALAESVALIESRRPETVRRLSRRRRFAAMGVDVAGDVAVSMFARRGVGCVWQDSHVLVLREGQWTLLGGGSRTGEQDVLADRPAVLPTSLGVGRDPVVGTAARLMVVESSGGIHDGGDQTQRWPWNGRWISYASVRVAAQVASVQVTDRLLPVPWHGHVVVAWLGRRAPLVGAHDGRGQRLGEVPLPSTR